MAQIIGKDSTLIAKINGILVSSFTEISGIQASTFFQSLVLSDFYSKNASAVFQNSSEVCTTDPVDMYIQAEIYFNPSTGQSYTDSGGTLSYHAPLTTGHYAVVSNGTVYWIHYKTSVDEVFEFGSC